MRVIILGLCLLCSQIVSASDLTLASEVVLKSNFLNEDSGLLVKLPDEYDPKNKRYPVLYLLHGQWDMLSTVSTLDLLVDELPEFIVVGVESKGMELRPKEGEVTSFAQYLSQEVVPYVNQHYSTAPFSVLSGHSNSGRFVLDFWLMNNKPFSHYYAFSPSLDDGYIVNLIAKLPLDSFKDKAPLVMTIANEGEHMQTPFDTLTAVFDKQPQLDFSSKKFPQQSHRTTKHPSMQFALQTTFTGWTPSREVKIGGLDGLKAHYADLTKKYGFRVDVPIETLQKLTAYYATSDNAGAANSLKQIIEFTLGQSNKGPDALFEIADYLSNNGYEKAGATVFKGICDQASRFVRCEG